MKKFTISTLLAILIIIPSILTFSQTKKSPKNTYDLKPLFQVFTSSTCPPCASANPIIDSILENNPGTHTLIKYQMNWPGVGDPYYTAEGGIRKTYYSVTGVPTLFINPEQVDPWSLDQVIYDSYVNTTTDMTISIGTAEIDENFNITVSVDIEVASDYSAGLTAHIVVVEKKTVNNTGSNGETDFSHVMMKMLPDAYGTILSALTPGTTETITETYDMSLTNMEGANDLAVIVFVQDDTDKSIVQSEEVDVASNFEVYDVTFTMVDTDDNLVEGAECYLQNIGTAYSDADGQIVYEGVFPGTYNYDVIAAGLYPNSGIFDVLDEDVNVEVVLEIPEFYFYEDFTENIPDEWTVHTVAGGDYLYWYDGRVIFFRQSGTLDPIMLVSPVLDLDRCETLFFNAGEQDWNPILSLGTVTDPSDPSTFIELATYFPGDEPETFEYDMSQISSLTSSIYLAWRLNSSENSFFSLFDIAITEKFTSVEDQLSENFQLFPNPASNVVNIKSDIEIIKISVFNSTGHLLSTELINTNMSQVNTTKYTPGLYLFQIKTTEGTHTEQIIIK